MSDRAAALADTFAAANDELMAAIEHCSDTQWKTKTKPEGWSVGVTAHHVAGGHEAIGNLVQLIANGQQLPPLTKELLDQRNAEHAQQFANRGKRETLELL